MIDGMLEIGAEGVSAAPKAAPRCRHRQLLKGAIAPDSVVLFNTGGALKFLDVLPSAS